VHNFIDGIAIAAAFLASPLTGIVVTIAVAIHEVPQEIADFSLLLKKGIKRRKVLLINALSALSTTVAAIVFYLIGSLNEISFAPVLGIVAGFFIYIAVSDIIPTIHEKKNRSTILTSSIILVSAAILVYALIEILHHIDFH
jgi:zinc and cadmium transporter